MPKNIRFRNLTPRSVHPKIYIWSHTERAEIEYFQQYKQHFNTFQIVPKKHVAYTPQEMIDRTTDWKLNQQLDPNDEVWCIFDVDNFFISQPQDLLKSIKRAETNGVKIAYANECFELWYLLHFEIPTSGERGERLISKIKQHFKRNNLGVFTKNKQVFEILFPFLNQAMKNGQKLYDRQKTSDFNKLLSNECNPSTNIHMLVNKINSILTSKS